MSAVEQVAASLIRSWQEGRRQPLPSVALTSEAEAYEVQRQVAETIGGLACSGPQAWKLGGAPAGLISAARVPSAAVHGTGWQAPADYCFAFGIEGELFVRLAHDLDEHTDLAKAYAAIDAWMPGIELCDTRWVRGERAAPLLRLADQQLNRALILGEPQRLQGLPNWAQQAVELKVDGAVVFSASGSHPFAEPLHSLPWLARHAAAQGQPLRAGDLVATGSWTGLYWAPMGAQVEVAFMGLGSVVMHT